jgi:hypothetical protein
MPKRVLLAVIVLLLSTFFSAGCRIGLGIGVETRVGVIYFLSTRDDVFGQLYLDGEALGYIAPHEYLGKWIFLDFKHQIELHCGYCGTVHSMILNPPLYAGQVVTLDFNHQD